MPFVFASNGDGFVFHDKTVLDGQPIESEITLNDFPAPSDLWAKCKITHANCWAHSRRKFEQALKMEPELAQQALDIIARLYRNEAHCRDNSMPREEVLKYRQKQSEPVVNTFLLGLINNDKILVCYLQIH